MQKDYSKFANQRFLKTVDWPALGRLLDRHRSKLPGLNLDELASNPVEGRKKIADYLVGSKDSYPDTLIHDLHRIVRPDSPVGMPPLMEEAEPQGVLVIAPGKCPTATARDYALVAFVDFPDVFREAE